MTCTTSSLAGLGLRDRHDLQALGSSLAAVGSRLHKACVHHIPHPRHCHRGLSNVGGQDDLHSTATPMPLSFMMVHHTEWQRSINHTVQCLRADFFSSNTSFVSFWLSKGFPRWYIANEVWVVLCRLAYQQLLD